MFPGIPSINLIVSFAHRYAKALVLVGLTLGLILTSGTLISCMSNETLGESLWKAALGSGLDWSFIDSEQPSLRLAAVCTNVGGLVLTALLLSLISDAVQTKYDSLRKGESPVTVSYLPLLPLWGARYSFSNFVYLCRNKGTL